MTDTIKTRPDGTKYITLEPNYPALKDWWLRMRDTDLAQYRRCLAADTSGSMARWLGETWPLPTLKAMRAERAAWKAGSRGYQARKGGR